MVRFEREGREGNPHGYWVTRPEVTRMLARFLEVPEAQRRRVPGMPPQRADIIVAGTAVIARLAKHLRARQVLVNDGGVRDGLILTMIGDMGLAASPAAAAPTRMDAVRRFARRCLANERHGEHVALLAGQIFDGVRNRYRLSPAGRELLVAAGLLHDVGFLVNHAKHHKHAYHLIMHSDLAGWSSREIELIANVVRYHRRAYPKKAHANFKRLAKADRRLVERLAAILRVGVALNRSHQQLVRGVQVYTRKDRVTVVALADEEPLVELWDARRKTRLFERAFDARLTFKTSQAKERGNLRVVRARRRA
jgi:exopolyphosphatase/guanosine-5'-triphosphate,3'-diphosphate pyrophosphatase